MLLISICSTWCNTAHQQHPIWWYFWTEQRNCTRHTNTVRCACASITDATELHINQMCLCVGFTYLAVVWCAAVNIYIFVWYFSNYVLLATPIRDIYGALVPSTFRMTKPKILKIRKLSKWASTSSINLSLRVSKTVTLLLPTTFIFACYGVDNSNGHFEWLPAFVDTWTLHDIRYNPYINSIFTWFFSCSNTIFQVFVLKWISELIAIEFDNLFTYGFRRRWIFNARLFI